MSIELHCPACTKLIRAPEAAGGRHGKCPYCEARVYIPMPPAEEEIGIAPVDEEEERRSEEQMRREEAALAASLSREEATPGEPAGGGGRSREAPGEVIDVDECVEAFILAMRDSQLDAAERAVGLLRRAGSKARDYVQGAMVDEIPPPIEGVPPALVKGFLKTLLGRLK